MPTGRILAPRAHVCGVHVLSDRRNPRLAGEAVAAFAPRKRPQRCSDSLRREQPPKFGRQPAGLIHHRSTGISSRQGLQLPPVGDRRAPEPPRAQPRGLRRPTPRLRSRVGRAWKVPGLNGGETTAEDTNADRAWRTTRGREAFTGDRGDGARPQPASAASRAAAIRSGRVTVATALTF